MRACVTPMFEETRRDLLPNKVMAAEYRTRLPAEKLLVERIEQVRRRFGGGE